MWTPRLMPCLLLRGRSLVKTTRFKDPRYVGDPTTAVQIFNEKEVDEVVILDITATVDGKTPNFGMIEDLACECFMPVTYGGGVTSLESMEALFALGVEKIAVNSALVERPDLVRAAADRFGSQSIVASIDARSAKRGRYSSVIRGGTKDAKIDPADLARRAADLGAGEVLLTSVDRDGTRTGYDLDLTRAVTSAVSVPVVAAGGAGSLEHVTEVLRVGATAAAVGSLVVYHGRNQAVLISFPPRDEVRAATSW